MARYLVERYLPASAAAALGEDVVRLRGSPDANLVMTFYAAEDETCFHLLDAGSLAAVRRAGASAGLTVDRIVSVETVTGDAAVQPEHGGAPA